MRYLIVSCVMLSFILVGCQSGDSDKSSLDNSIIPIVGIWKADTGPFVIKIEKGPKLEWAIVNPGSVKVYPNKRVEFPMKDDTIGYFQAGECPMTYNQNSGELTVEINVTELMIPFPDDKLEGHVQHTFVGFIADDLNSWDTTWFEVFDYGPRFPMAEGDQFTGIPVKFTRIEE